MSTEHTERTGIAAALAALLGAAACVGGEPETGHFRYPLEIDNASSGGVRWEVPASRHEHVQLRELGDGTFGWVPPEHFGDAIEFLDGAEWRALSREDEKRFAAELSIRGGAEAGASAYLLRGVMAGVDRSNEAAWKSDRLSISVVGDTVQVTHFVYRHHPFDERGNYPVVAYLDRPPSSVLPSVFIAYIGGVMAD